MAERVGFEPTVPDLGTPIFETGALSHYATSPFIDLLGFQPFLFEELLHNLLAFFG